LNFFGAQLRNLGQRLQLFFDALKLAGRGSTSDLKEGGACGMAPEARVPEVCVLIPLDLFNFGADDIAKLKYRSTFTAMSPPTRLLSDMSSDRFTRIQPGTLPSLKSVVIRLARTVALTLCPKLK
jgi:hypothetical protein